MLWFLYHEKIDVEKARYDEGSAKKADGPAKG